MLRRSRTKHKLIVIALILGFALLYNELVAYEIQSLEWASRECSDDCVKVLLVADPQILGERDENYFGAWLARWDSDRYLRKTFSRAVEHARPDVIAFLGDLMDEGHIASADHFRRYKRRFDDIFHTSDSIMKIYVPGDNDIGGEEDTVSSRMLERFEFAFSQPDALTCKSVSFFKVNRLTNAVPPAPPNAFLNDYAERNTTNVILSHLPLLFTPGNFVQSVLKDLTPQILFTAHEHKALHISLDTATDQLSEIWVLLPHKTPFYQLRLDTGDIHELQIPTCSYRMGTPYMGYGLAHIDTQEKTLDFTVLWLPGRFPQLILYVVVSLLAALFSAVFLYGCGCRSTGHHAGYTRVPQK